MSAPFIPDRCALCQQPSPDDDYCEACRAAQCATCDERATRGGFCATCFDYCDACTKGGAATNGVTLRVRGRLRRLHARCAGPVAIDVYRSAVLVDPPLARAALDALMSYVAVRRAELSPALRVVTECAHTCEGCSTCAGREVSL